MFLLLSPAKSLNTDEKNSLYTDKPYFLDEIKTLVLSLQQLSATDIASLMKLSDKLASLNYNRFQDFDFNYAPANTSPAALLFNGDVYKGLSFSTLSEESIEYASSHIGVLSGLYGLLKPLDVINDYRLEMGTKYPIGEAKNLYQFWGDKIATLINEKLESSNSKYLLNLASNEYFKAVNKKIINTPIVDVDFKDFKNGAYKTISFYAKNARGVMARYVVENKVETIDQLKAFGENGYYFNEDLSTEKKLVFYRD